MIRNFDKQIVHLELNRSATSAENVSSRATDPDRVVLHLHLAGGRVADARGDTNLIKP